MPTPEDLPISGLPEVFALANTDMIPVVANGVTSFIKYSNFMTQLNDFNIDAFGRLRVSEATSLIELKHTFDALPSLVNEVKLGTGNSTHSIENASVTMTVSANADAVIRVSKQHAVYQPGKGQLFEASLSNFELETNVIKRVGYFTSSTVSPYSAAFDGFFLESNGVTNEISFQLWKSGTQVFKKDTTQWMTTDYDSASLDWSKTQLMMVDFQWLGVGRLRFSMVIDGIPRHFVDHTGTNNLTDVYMSSPSKPIRYEIRSAGGTGSFDQICSQVSLEGTLNRLENRVLVSNQDTVTLATSGTKYAYLGIKPAAGYESISATLKDVTILNTSNDNYLVTIEINPTLSTSVSYAATNGPALLLAKGDGTQTVTANGTILGGFIGEAGAQALSTYEFGDSKIAPGLNLNGVPDELWICITPLGANATFLGAANLSYYS